MNQPNGEIATVLDLETQLVEIKETVRIKRYVLTRPTWLSRYRWRWLVVILQFMVGSSVRFSRFFPHQALQWRDSDGDGFGDVAL